MALVRALNSAISGLRAHQFRTDVIGDNLANVSTTAFKSGRVHFQTMLSQTLSYGSAPQGFLGGVDPRQLGLGVSIADTHKNFNQGSIEATGINSDLAIEGDGFFILNNSGGTSVYSRDGAFSINPAKLLHNPTNGYIVQGYQADFTTFEIMAGGPLTNVNIPVGELKIADATQNAIFDGNLNGGGDIANSGTLLESETYLELDPVTRLPVVASERAGLNTDLVNLGRQTTGTGYVDMQLADGVVDQDGDGNPDPATIIEVNVVKGTRSLPTKKFQVSPASNSPAPPGIDGAGRTLGDFIDFLEDVLGINNGVSSLADSTYGAYVGNGVVSTVTNNPVDTITFADVDDGSGQGATFGDLELGDFIRFTSGGGAGQIAQITALAWAAGVSSLTFAPLDATRPMPAPGDQFELNEPARVTLGVEGPPALDPFPGVPASVDPDREDQHSLGGRLRIAGNAGEANGFNNLTITAGGTSFGLFQKLADAAGESVTTNATVYDSLGSAHVVEITYYLESSASLADGTGNRFRWLAEAEDADGPDRVIGNGYIQFKTDGSYLSENPQTAISMGLPVSGAVDPLIFSVDHSSLTGFDDIQSEVALVDQDGVPFGVLDDWSVDQDGVITGIFDNGQTRSLGQLALARFPNNNGLQAIGANLFAIGANSGLPVVGPPGSFARGIIHGGFLEESNVELAKEFTDLIVSQRAFQANARTITVANQMLQDLVNII